VNGRSPLLIRGIELKADNKGPRCAAKNRSVSPYEDFGLNQVATAEKLKDRESEELRNGDTRKIPGANAYATMIIFKLER
jgi:hypothetical protein